MKEKARSIRPGASSPAFDPARTITAATYIELLQLRERFISTIKRPLPASYDAMLMAHHSRHRADDRRSHQGRRELLASQRPRNAAQPIGR